MKEKIDNNLVMITIDGGEPMYYTSMNRAAVAAKVVQSSITWAILRGNDTLTNKKGETIKVKMVDGSKIPYELINNYRE